MSEPVSKRLMKRGRACSLPMLGNFRSAPPRCPGGIGLATEATKHHKCASSANNGLPHRDRPPTLADPRVRSALRGGGC